MDTIVPMAEEDRSAWPTHAQVAKKLKRSVSTIRRMREDGQLEAVFAAGVWRFNPEMIDDVAEALPVDDGENPASVSAQLLREAQALLKAAGAQTADAYRQLTTDRESSRAATKDLLDTMSGVVKTQEERVRTLEARVQEMVAASEKALSEEHARLLSREAFDAEQRRLDKATDFVMSFQPLVQAMVAKRFGIPETGEAVAIADFLTSFTPAEVTSMVRDLPSEKAAVVLGIWEQAVERKKSSTAKPTQAANGNGAAS